MPKNNAIQVFEHEKLTLHSDKRFQEKHLKSLISFNDSKDNKYFKVIRDGVKFTQYAGVIQAGNLTIEVLPKADKETNLSKGRKRLWRDVLLNMLRECGLLKVDHVEKANLNLRSNSLLEIYIQLFLTEVEQIIREGLLKKYIPNNGNKMALKGRLNFSKNLTQNIAHRERFYVNFIEYSTSNVFNQIIKKTLQTIPKMSNSPLHNDRVQRLLLNMPDLPECKITPTIFDKLVYNRKSERYKEALLISKILLLNFRPDITGGNENVIAILFDMNKLWEEFVYRRLKKEEVAYGFKVSRQQIRNFWQPSFGQLSPKKIRPDLQLKRNGESIIIDTKWKINNDLMPDDSDLKQMFVYNLFWNCDRSILLYPATNETSGHGSYIDFKNPSGYHTHCSIETLNILDSKNELDEEIGRKILNRIFEMSDGVT